LSYDGSFAREWINTLLNIPVLISAPDHLCLFSLPVVLIDASGAQKHRCARLSLTPEEGTKGGVGGYLPPATFEIPAISSTPMELGKVKPLKFMTI
jgi:hypothetical protein